LKESINLFWFRRDLRINDNAGLFHALKERKNVVPIFIFDTDILDRLESKEDQRLDFIYEHVKAMQDELRGMGSDLLIKLGSPRKVFSDLITEYNIESVYCNHDYEPIAIERDHQIKKLLEHKETEFFTFKDQVIFEKSEITKDDGKPYTVFTPYMKKWKAKLSPFYIKKYPVKNYLSHLKKIKFKDIPTMKEIGFVETVKTNYEPTIPEDIISNYHLTRDFPALKGTSRLSVHLRFGTVSIRELVQRAKKLNDTWLNELIWREFYMMILYHFPHVAGNAFKKDYDKIEWSNNEEHYNKWCEGKTGYPIVDAGMRELNKTGFMHNRVRMITASFLTKHLLIDWRWGEAYFAKKLLDFELSSNNGGWQWSASSGCDAAPYFRIFNPWEQTKKFDPELKYIKKWIPEYDELNYIQPIVDHKWARERVLKTYKRALEKEKVD
jgi:deoxyribodipyrimidine photo-lyase